MDKYEFNIKVEQIKKLVNKGDFETAMKIADTCLLYTSLWILERISANDRINDYFIFCNKICDGKNHFKEKIIIR